MPQPVAEDPEQQIVDIAPCGQSPIAIVLDSSFPPKKGDAEFQDDDTECNESRTTNTTTANHTSMLASLRVINEKIDWENITNNLTWGDDDDQLSGDKEERAM
jgi:hypothetical protein